MSELKLKEALFEINEAEKMLENADNEFDEAKNHLLSVIEEDETYSSRFIEARKKYMKAKDNVDLFNGVLNTKAANYAGVLGEMEKQQAAT